MNVKGAKLTVIFGLVQDIDIVTARCSDKDKSQYVLEALYPDDPGDSWPSGKQPAQDLQHCMARPYRCEVPGPHESPEFSAILVLPMALSIVQYWCCQARIVLLSHISDDESSIVR